MPDAGAHAIYPSLKGCSVFITGGGSGIGASLVRHFAAQAVWPMMKAAGGGSIVNFGSVS